MLNLLLLSLGDRSHYSEELESWLSGLLVWVETLDTAKNWCNVSL